MTDDDLEPESWEQYSNRNNPYLSWNNPRDPAKHHKMIAEWDSVPDHYKKWQKREAEKKERKQELKEHARELQREAERERRDPTPVFQPENFDITIPDAIRSQNIYVPGGSQRGKSSLLLRMIMGDIRAGKGVTVIDPKGYLVANVIFHLLRDGVKQTRIVNGKERNLWDDTIYLDVKTPVPLDVMGRGSTVADPIDEQIRVNNVINDLAFLALKGEAEQRARPILKKLLRSFLALPDTSFVDVYRFFMEPKGRRREILDALRIVKPEYRALWDEFPAPIEYRPITHRMQDFDMNPIFNKIFGAPKSDFSISRIMEDPNKILLVNLVPFNDDTIFYGSIIVSQFLQAVQQRAANFLGAEKPPHFLYVDEFEYFQTETFGKILDISGGLGLRLQLGNQRLDQLLSDNLSSILSNCKTFIFFQLSQKDASAFAGKIMPYLPYRLEKLKNFQSCYVVGDNPPVFKNNPPIYKLDKDDEIMVSGLIDRLRTQTLSKYPSQSAEIGQIRNPQPTPLHSTSIPHDEGDDDKGGDIWEKPKDH